MKRKSLILQLLALMLCVGTLPGFAQQNRKYQVFGVMFYNLENLFDTINNNGKYDLEFSPQGKNKWDGYKYKTKLHNLAYAISQMTGRQTPKGPAIIGVSEIENRSVLEDLVKTEPLKERGLKIIHHDSPDRRGVDVGMLYDPRMFRPINVTNHTLKLNYPTRDQMCVVGLLGGQRVGVIINHWPSRRGGEERSRPNREAAAELTKHIADSLLQIDPNMGVIIMGDLNDDPQNTSCALVLGAQKNMQDVQPGGFFNPFWKMLDSGIGSYCYRGGWNLFDQIIVNYNLLKAGGSKLKFLRSEVLNKEFLKQQEGQYAGYPWRTFSGGAWTGGYSDHFPTEIFLYVEN